MTIDALNEFAKALQADETMARGLLAAIGQEQGGDAAEAFAVYARKQGFAVTKQDVEAIQGNAEGTLADDELDGVAGGFLSASPAGTFQNFFNKGIHILR